MNLDRFKSKISQFSSCGYMNKLYFYFERVAKMLLHYHISANMLTLVGLGFAVLGLNFLALGSYFFAFICLILNRLCDVLDGFVARQKGITAFGAFFDIFSDYASAALFLWGFILSDITGNASSGSFYLMILTFSVAAVLGYTTISGFNFRKINQSGMHICAFGALQNSDHFIAIFFMCLIPSWFNVFAILFSLISVGKTMLLISGAYYTLEIAQKGKKFHDPK